MKSSIFPRSKFGPDQVKLQKILYQICPEELTMMVRQPNPSSKTINVIFAVMAILKKDQIWQNAQILFSKLDFVNTLWRVQAFNISYLKITEMNQYVDKIVLSKIQNKSLRSLAEWVIEFKKQANDKQHEKVQDRPFEAVYNLLKSQYSPDFKLHHKTKKNHSNTIRIKTAVSSPQHNPSIKRNLATFTMCNQSRITRSKRAGTNTTIESQRGLKYFFPNKLNKEQVNKVQMSTKQNDSSDSSSDCSPKIVSRNPKVINNGFVFNSVAGKVGRQKQNRKSIRQMNQTVTAFNTEAFGRLSKITEGDLTVDFSKFASKKSKIESFGQKFRLSTRNDSIRVLTQLDKIAKLQSMRISASLLQQPNQLRKRMSLQQRMSLNKRISLQKRFSIQKKNMHNNFVDMNVAYSIRNVQKEKYVQEEQQKQQLIDEARTKFNRTISSNDGRLGLDKLRRLNSLYKKDYIKMVVDENDDVNDYCGEIEQKVTLKKSEFKQIIGGLQQTKSIWDQGQESMNQSIQKKVAEADAKNQSTVEFSNVGFGREMGRNTRVQRPKVFSF